MPNRPITYADHMRMVARNMVTLVADLCNQGKDKAPIRLADVPASVARETAREYALAILKSQGETATPELVRAWADDGELSRMFEQLWIGRQELERLQAEIAERRKL